MIADLKAYPEYKNSGLPWLGKVPGHWDVLPNRAVFFEVNERGHTDEEMLSVTITKGIIPQKALLTDSSKKDSSRQDKSAYKLVMPNEIAYNKMRAWQGAIGVSSLRGIVSPAYVVERLRDDTAIPMYYHYLYRTPNFAKEAERWSYGITSDMWSLRPEHFKMIYSPVPPPTEQSAIVRFLNWANDRLDRAIRAKRKTIALLNEQKQTIIHRAVTRGLDPNVKLKDSGIPWLGKIPEHWGVKQTRHMGRLFKGIGGSKEDATASGIPCVRYGELYMHFNGFVQHARFFIHPTKAPDYAPIQFGDVLFAASGEKVDEIGKSAVNLLVGHAVCGGDIIVLRPTGPTHALFLGYAYNSYLAAFQKATMCRGTTIKHIYPDELRNLRLCIPRLEEQILIANSLDESLRQQTTAITRLEREIELLREYRTRLTADIVTGKLDVRSAAESLPETPGESVEPEPLEETIEDEDFVTVHGECNDCPSPVAAVLRPAQRANGSMEKDRRLDQANVEDEDFVAVRPLRGHSERQLPRKPTL